MSKNTVIFIDLDGTLRDDRRNISQENVKVLNSLQDIGIKTVITTGRSISHVDNALKNKDGFYITLDGAQIYDIHNNTIIYESYISKEAITYIYGIVNQCNINIYTGKEKYCNIKLEEALNIDISKITIISEDRQIIIDSIKKVAKNNNINIANYSKSLIDNKFKSSNYYFDIVNSSVSKGSAVKFLSTYLNISIDNTIAIGDSINDISMFEQVGYKVAMGNAIDKLKAISDEITLSNNEDGVSHYLKKYIRKCKMKIGIANDHRGLVLKQTLTNYLINNGYNIIDYGTDTDDSVDYPDYAFKLGNAINNQEVDLGIAICGTGIGMDISLNKVKNVRCAKINTEEEAMLARSHNDANAIALSSKTNSTTAKELVKIFVDTPFSNEKRHTDRINKIKEYEND